MSDDAVPDWLRSNGKGDAEPLNNLESGGEVVEVAKERVGKAKIIYWGLKAVTMSLCLLMAATALIGLSKFTMLRGYRCLHR